MPVPVPHQSKTSVLRQFRKTDFTITDNNNKHIQPNQQQHYQLQQQQKEEYHQPQSQQQDCVPKIITNQPNLVPENNNNNISESFNNYNNQNNRYYHQQENGEKSPCFVENFRLNNNNNNNNQSEKVCNSYWPNQGQSVPPENYNVIKNDYRYNYCQQKKVEGNYYVKNPQQNYQTPLPLERRISPVQNYPINYDMRYQYQQNFHQKISPIPKKPNFTILEQRLTNQYEVNDYIHQKFPVIHQSKGSPTPPRPPQFIPKTPLEQNKFPDWPYPREFRDNRYFADIAQLDPRMAQTIVQHHNTIKNFDLPRDRFIENARYQKPILRYPEMNFQNTIRPIRPNFEIENQKFRQKDFNSCKVEGFREEYRNYLHRNSVPENPQRNISPRSTFQENMHTIVIPPPQIQNYPNEHFYNQGYFNKESYPNFVDQRQNVPRFPARYPENYENYQRFSRPEYQESEDRKSFENKDSEVSKLNLKEFFENWEDDEEIVANLPDLIPCSNVIERNMSVDSNYVSESSNDKFEEIRSVENLYILEKQNISPEMLSNFQHLTPVEKLPDNIKDFTNKDSPKAEVLNLSVSKEENNNLPKNLEVPTKPLEVPEVHKSVIVSNIKFDTQENQEKVSENLMEKVPLTIPFKSNSSHQTENVNRLLEYVNNNTIIENCPQKLQYPEKDFPQLGKIDSNNEKLETPLQERKAKELPIQEARQSANSGAEIPVQERKIDSNKEEMDIPIQERKIVSNKEENIEVRENSNSDVEIPVEVRKIDTNKENMETSFQERKEVQKIDSKEEKMEVQEARCNITEMEVPLERKVVSSKEPPLQGTIDTNLKQMEASMQVKCLNNVEIPESKIDSNEEKMETLLQERKIDTNKEITVKTKAEVKQFSPPELSSPGVILTNLSERKVVDAEDAKFTKNNSCVFVEKSDEDLLTKVNLKTVESNKSGSHFEEEEKMDEANFDSTELNIRNVKSPLENEECEENRVKQNVEDFVDSIEKVSDSAPNEDSVEERPLSSKEINIEKVEDITENIIGKSFEEGLKEANEIGEELTNVIMEDDVQVDAKSTENGPKEANQKGDEEKIDILQKTSSENSSEDIKQLVEDMEVTEQLKDTSSKCIEFEENIHESSNEEQKIRPQDSMEFVENLENESLVQEQLSLKDSSKEICTHFEENIEEEEEDQKQNQSNIEICPDFIQIEEKVRNLNCAHDYFEEMMSTNTTEEKNSFDNKTSEIPQKVNLDYQDSEISKRILNTSEEHVATLDCKIPHVIPEEKAVQKIFVDIGVQTSFEHSRNGKKQCCIYQKLFYRRNLLSKRKKFLKQRKNSAKKIYQERRLKRLKQRVLEVKKILAKKSKLEVEKDLESDEPFRFMNPENPDTETKESSENSKVTEAPKDSDSYLTNGLKLNLSRKESLALISDDSLTDNILHFPKRRVSETSLPRGFVEEKMETSLTDELPMIKRRSNKNFIPIDEISKNVWEAFNTLSDTSESKSTESRLEDREFSQSSCESFRREDFEEGKKNNYFQDLMSVDKEICTKTPLQIFETRKILTKNILEDRASHSKLDKEVSSDVLDPRLPEEKMLGVIERKLQAENLNIEYSSEVREHASSSGINFENSSELKENVSESNIDLKTCVEEKIQSKTSKFQESLSVIESSSKICELKSAENISGLDFDIKNYEETFEEEDKENSSEITIESKLPRDNISDLKVFAESPSGSTPNIDVSSEYAENVSPIGSDIKNTKIFDSTENVPQPETAEISVLEPNLLKNSPETDINSSEIGPKLTDSLRSNLLKENSAGDSKCTENHRLGFDNSKTEEAEDIDNQSTKSIEEEKETSAENGGDIAEENHSENSSTDIIAKETEITKEENKSSKERETKLEESHLSPPQLELAEVVKPPGESLEQPPTLDLEVDGTKIENSSVEQPPTLDLEVEAPKEHSVEERPEKSPEQPPKLDLEVENSSDVIVRNIHPETLDESIEIICGTNDMKNYNFDEGILRNSPVSEVYYEEYIIENTGTYEDILISSDQTVIVTSDECSNDILKEKNTETQIFLEQPADEEILIENDVENIFQEVIIEDETEEKDDLCNLEDPLASTELTPPPELKEDFIKRPFQINGFFSKAPFDLDINKSSQLDIKKSLQWSNLIRKPQEKVEKMKKVKKINLNDYRRRRNLQEGQKTPLENCAESIEQNIFEMAQEERIGTPDLHKSEKNQPKIKVENLKNPKQENNFEPKRPKSIENNKKPKFDPKKDLKDPKVKMSSEFYVRDDRKVAKLTINRSRLTSEAKTTKEENTKGFKEDTKSPKEDAKSSKEDALLLNDPLPTKDDLKNRNGRLDKKDLVKELEERGKKSTKNLKKMYLLEAENGRNMLFLDPLLLKRSNSDELKTEAKRARVDGNDDKSKWRVFDGQSEKEENRRRSSSDMEKPKKFQPKMEKETKTDPHNKDNNMVPITKRKRKKKRFRNLYTLSDSDEETVHGVLPELKVKIPRDCLEQGKSFDKFLVKNEKDIPKVLIKKNGTTYVSSFMKNIKEPFWQPRVLLKRYPSSEILKITKNKT